MSAKTPVAIRVDASSQIGFGHVARCMTLAEALSKNGQEIIFCIKENGKILLDFMTRRSFQVHLVPGGANAHEDAQSLVAAVKKHQCRAAILDGYEFDDAYLQSIRPHVSFMLSIDDLAQTSFCSDMVLNQNVHASAEHYQGKLSNDHKLLLGPRYALLRSEFGELSSRQRDFPEVKNILVTFGGADPRNVTLKALEALKEIKGDCLVNVTLGLANPHKKEIQEYVFKSKRNIQLFENTPRMAELMLEADLAISSGGTITWELCCLGVPTLQIILAQNQINAVQELARRGITQNIGWHEQTSTQQIHQAVAGLMADRQTRKEMSARAKALVDGLGTQRVMSEILSYLN